MTAVYSREEVLKHDSVEDAWMIVDQRVFDVTSFLYTHPGGLSITEEYLGRDISSLLRSEDVHRHSQTAFEVLEQYCVGRLADYKVLASIDSINAYIALCTVGLHVSIANFNTFPTGNLGV